jgi:flagellar hook-length control protein FliK
MTQQAMLQNKKEEEAMANKLVDETEAKRLVDEEEAKLSVDEAEAKRSSDEAKEKWVANEVEAKKKATNILKQQKLQNLTHTPISPSTPNLGIVNVPPQEYTPISTIPGDSSFSSQALNFEGSVVSIGDYYFDNRTRSIENISSKRKRG